MARTAAKNVEDVKVEKKENEEPDIQVVIEGEETAPERSEAEAVSVEGVGEKSPEADAGADSIRKQIEELKKAHELAHQKAQEAERNALLMAQQLNQYRQSAEQSRITSLDTAIGAAQMEIDTAKRDIVLAGQAQDYESLADAQERLATAKAHMVSLEHSKQQQRPQQVGGGDQFNQAVDADQNLTWDEKNWIKSHPEVINDPRKNAKLNAAYFDAMDKGLQRGSRDYFNFIEERLGYREPPKANEPEEESSIVVAAPPSKTVPSGSGTGGNKNGSYTMTKEEAEVARLSGISPSEYVKQREILRKLKKINPGDYPDS